MNFYENPHIREPSPIVVESAVLRVVTLLRTKYDGFPILTRTISTHHRITLRHHSLSLISSCKAVRPHSLRYHERLESESFYTSPFRAVVLISSIFYGSRFYQYLK